MADLSDYEKLRIANILRNEAEMKRLGLDVSKLTNAALGRQAPTATTRRRAVRPKGAPPTRRSLRAMGKPAPAYSDAAVERDARQAESAELASLSPSLAAPLRACALTSHDQSFAQLH